MSETLFDLRGLTVNFATDDGIVRVVDGEIRFEGHDLLTLDPRHR